MRKALFLLVLIPVLLGCEGTTIVDPPPTQTVTDYTDHANWMAFTDNPVENADIFYIHPTTYYGHSDVVTDNWTIDPESEPAIYAYGAMISQVSIFDGIANPYAPFYQQVRVGTIDELPDESSAAFGLAFADVRAAFSNFISQNNGRPFFIFGHSQGAHMGLLLIKELFSDEELSSRLIAAYLVGWPVTQADLDAYPHLKVLTSPTETGGVATWDVVAEDATMVLPTKAPNSIMVNPLTWTLSKDPVPAEYNLGAVFFGEVGMDYVPVSFTPGLTGCQIKEMPAIPGYMETSYTALVTPNLANEMQELGAEINEWALHGCYHIEAVNLFYTNIAQNALERKQAWFAK